MNHVKFALDANDGGTLYSSFADESLRNFYAYNATWTDFQTAGNTIGHDNFEFEITFKNNVAIPSSPFSSLFYHNGQQGTVNIAYSADYSVNFMYYKMWADDETALYPGVVTKAAIDARGVDIVSAGAVHTWKWGKVGSTIYVKINDITVLTNTQTYLETSNYKSNIAPGSVFNGNILSAKLTNLTSNVVLWEASKNQLYNADAIFPSATLRNFATENATWQDFTYSFNAIGIDDFSLAVEVNINPCAGKNIFYQTAPYKGIGVFRGGAYTSYDFYFLASKLLYDANNVAQDTSFSIKIGETTTDNLTGIYKFKIERIGATINFYLNDILVATSTRVNPAPTNLNGDILSNFDGNILKVELKNLTKNKKMWTYPSFEEQTRLITKVNTYCDNGCFEGTKKTGTIANTNIWNIKTSYNLINQPLKSTYYCRANFASMTDTSTAMQWGFSTGNNLRAFYIQYASGSYSLIFAFVGKTLTGTVNEQLTITDQSLILPLLNKFIDYMIVIDDIAKSYYIYASGRLLASKAFTGTNIGFYSNTDYQLYIGSTVTGACRADLSKVEKFAYFNRVFSDGEIKAISA